MRVQKTTAPGYIAACARGLPSTSAPIATDRPCGSSKGCAKSVKRWGQFSGVSTGSAENFSSRLKGDQVGSHFVPPILLDIPPGADSPTKRHRKIAAQATTTIGTPNADGWIKYQGDPSKGSKAAWLPIAIGVATGLYAYPKVLPYMLALLDNIRQAHWAPRYLGIPVLDAFLGILVPFFQDVLATADYGHIVVAYFSSVILAWVLAAGIESSRLDAPRSKLVQVFSPWVSLKVVSGVGALTPLLWVGPFLRMPGNTDSAAQLTPAMVAGKLVSTHRVRLLAAVILVSFVPYVTGHFMTGIRFYATQLLVLLAPLVWPLLWGSTTTTDADTPTVGHAAAERVHTTALGVGLLQHVLCVAQLLERPGMLSRMLGLFHNHPLHVRPTLFVLVTTFSLWAALLCIPLSQ